MGTGLFRGILRRPSSSGENKSSAASFSRVCWDGECRGCCCLIKQKKKRRRMRLLWVLVVVGVAGGVAKKEGVRLLTLEEIEKYTLHITKEDFWAVVANWKACGRAADVELCSRGFVFAVRVLGEVRSGGELEVLLSVERSHFPQVTFGLTLRSVVDKDRDLFTWKGHEEEWGEETILAGEEVTLEANELRKVVLRVSDLQWKKALLFVKAYPTGHPQIHKHSFYKTEISKVNSEVEVFVQTEKEEYAPGDTVNYRALVVDGNVDKTPKFAQVILTKELGSLSVLLFKTCKEIRLPWVEVVDSGIVSGNFTFDDFTHVRVRVTSNVTSSDSSLATTPGLRLTQRSSEVSPSQLMSVRLEGRREVFVSQRNLKGRVTLTSLEGIPLEGNCNVTIEREWWEESTLKMRKVAGRNVTVGLAGGEFEFDVVEELEVVRPESSSKPILVLKAKCRHALSGNVEFTTETIHLFRSLFNVGLVSVGSPPAILRLGNSSHPRTTVGLRFLVGRWDGGSVEEEEHLKRLQIKLLLSEETLKRLRPSATNFSVPVPPNGQVKLEFEVNGPPTFHRDDRIRMEVGDAEEEARLNGPPVLVSPEIHVTPVDPAQLIRKGDVVKFRLRSCLHYDNVNAILSSRKAIYSSRRFSFSPEEEELDEVIELTIPQNATEGSLLLTVYGHSKNVGSGKEGDSASVQVNVVPSSGPQYIRIVDQVDVDMSTIVTFRLEGMLAGSVVSLQAAKLESPGLEAEEREDVERPLRCHVEWFGITRQIQDDSPGAVDPCGLRISANFGISGTSFSRPRSLVFIGVAGKTMDNGTLTVTKIFDRSTEFGTYVVSGATFNSKSGRSLFSNYPTLTILPPPVTLSLSVPPSVILGETFEVIGYVKNNLAAPFESQVTLDWSEGGFNEVTEHQVVVKPNPFGILKVEVTPRFVGDVILSLRSNGSNLQTATQTVRVKAAGETINVTKYFILSEKEGSHINGTFRARLKTFELPINCTPSTETSQIVFQGDILGDISAFVHLNQFKIVSRIRRVLMSYAKILSSLAAYHSAKNDDAALQRTVSSLKELKIFWDPFHFEYSSVSGIASRIQVGGAKFPDLPVLDIGLEEFLMRLKLMQQDDGSFQERATTLTSALAVGVIIDTTLALSAVSEIQGKQIDRHYFEFNTSDFKRGVEFLREMTTQGHVKDNVPLSLVTFLFSQLDDKDTPTLFKKLESTASNDSDGIFWASNLNWKTWTDSLAPSVTATSYALMTYVNMKKLEEADEIARWLVAKKNVNGFYESFEDTAAAVESLAKYATLYASVKGEWPSLVKLTQKCVITTQNVSAGEGFSVQTVAEKDGGTLYLKICSKEHKLGRLKAMEASQPSGYKNCIDETILGNPIFGHPIFYLKPTECKNLKYYRMHKVYGRNSKENRILMGSVSYYDFFDPLTRSVSFLEAIINEGDLKTVKD